MNISVMLVSRGGVNFAIYPDVILDLMKDAIFVLIISPSNQDMKFKKATL